jgi:hypothetical protein
MDDGASPDRDQRRTIYLARPYRIPTLPAGEDASSSDSTTSVARTERCATSQSPRLAHVRLRARCGVAMRLSILRISMPGDASLLFDR